jgi:mycothiol synthase
MQTVSQRFDLSSVEEDYVQRNSVEDQFAIHLFRQDEDLLQLVRLRIEIEAVDQVGNDTSEEALRTSMNWPGHNPARDRWVVEALDNPDKLIGYAWIRAQSGERTILYVAIHPEWRQRGLGSALLDHALTRAREHGATHVTAAANVRNTAADAFLCHHGFYPAGNNRFMRAPTAISLAEPSWPAGYTVRSYAEVQDLSTLVEVFNRSYSDMWGHRENTKGAMNEDYLAEAMQKYPEWYVPEGLFIAFASDGDVAGVCKAVFGAEVKGQGKECRKIVDSPGRNGRNLSRVRFHTGGALHRVPQRSELSSELTVARWLTPAGADHAIACVHRRRLGQRRCRRARFLTLAPRGGSAQH